MKRLTSRLNAVVAAATLVATGVAISPPSTATASDDGTQFISESRAFLGTFGVNDATQDQLIATLANGGQWESMSSADHQPVSLRVQYADGVTWQVSEYADGSIGAEYIGPATPASSTLRLADSSAVVSPMGVNDCGYSSGKTGNFSNCNIYLWVGAIQMGFKANFTIQSGGYDSISLVWGATWAIGGACSANQQYFGRPKVTESSTGPALALLTVSAQMCLIGYNQTFNSQLSVGSNTATHSWW